MASEPEAALVWFRNDLRIQDHPALEFAASEKMPIIPVFICPVGLGSASKWWLYHSLKALQTDLSKTGLRLVLRKGKPIETLQKILKETGAKTLLFHRSYDPGVHEEENNILRAFEPKGIQIRILQDRLLFDPEAVIRDRGQPYKVFTAFYNRCLALPEPREPVLKPLSLILYPRKVSSLRLKDLDLLPKKNWARGFEACWVPGEEGASRQFARFLKSKMRNYSKARDVPDQDATSRLSPYLAFGEISLRKVWHEVKKRASRKSFQSRKAAELFLRQILWREFAYHLLHHFPETVTESLQKKFARFPWKKAPDQMHAWQKGRTGYPIIDAGMRQLWKTGWMHNRVRMIVASFLVKDLLLPWQKGAEWFWDTLVDADLANNTMGWQWCAGSGADAAPFFRIFNPLLQGKKFDPQGKYVRKWVPEISKLPDRWIHEPWNAPKPVLEKSGVRIGKDYPAPIVDHEMARRRALMVFRKLG